MAVTRSVLWLFVAEFLFYVSGYVVHMGAGRMLGPEDYGRYGLIITATLLVANLVGGGIPIAMSKALSAAAATDPGLVPVIRRRAAVAQALVMGAVTLVAYLAAPLIAAAIGDPGLAPQLRLAAVIIPCFAADAYYFYYYSGTQRFGVQSVLKIVRSLLRMTVILWLTHLYGLTGIIAGYILVPSLVLAAAVAIDIATPRRDTRQAVGTFAVGQIIRAAVPVTAFLVLFEVLMSFDLYVLRHVFQDDALAGQYNAALTVARIPTFLFYALTIILLPTIAESFSRADRARVTMLVTQAFRFMLILTLPTVALMAAYAQPALTLLFGQAFAPAAAMLPLLAVGTGAFTFLYVLAFAYKGAGRIRTPLLMTVGALVVNAAADVLLLPLAGAAAVPVAKALTAALLLPVLLWSLARVFGLRYDLRAVGIVAVATAGVYALAACTPPTTVWMIGGGTVLLAVYVAVLVVTGVITADDRAFLHRDRRTA